MFLCSGKTGGSILPVSDIPELVDIIGTNVLVLQIVSMLPNVNANNWNQTSSSLKLKQVSQNFFILMFFEISSV